MIWQGNKATPHEDYLLSVKSENGFITWKAENTNTGEKIEGNLLFDIEEAKERAAQAYAEMIGCKLVASGTSISFRSCI